MENDTSITKMIVIISVLVVGVLVYAGFTTIADAHVKEVAELKTEHSQEIQELEDQIMELKGQNHTLENNREHLISNLKDLAVYNMNSIDYVKDELERYIRGYENKELDYNDIAFC